MNVPLSLILFPSPLGPKQWWIHPSYDGSQGSSNFLGQIFLLAVTPGLFGDMFNTHKEIRWYIYIYIHMLTSIFTHVNINICIVTNYDHYYIVLLLLWWLLLLLSLFLSSMSFSTWYTFSRYSVDVGCIVEIYLQPNMNVIHDAFYPSHLPTDFIPTNRGKLFQPLNHDCSAGWNSVLLVIRLWHHIKQPCQLLGSVVSYLICLEMRNPSQ